MSFFNALGEGAILHRAGSAAAMELMTGFPPAPEDRVTLANWRKAPYNRWAFQHVREIVPSAAIAHDPAHPWELIAEPRDVGAFSFDFRGTRYDFARFLEATDTDGLVVLHDGRMVHESYRHGMGSDTPHLWMSVSKSLLGIVAGILTHSGVLDPDRAITDYVPEAECSAYAEATVRNLLDMRVGIHFDEDYLATSGPIIEYRKAQGWEPLGPGEVASDLRTFLVALTERDGQHGDRFHYVSPNTDLLGWVIERSAERRYADLLGELLWQPLGLSGQGYITVDRFGAPRCAGGINATLRDIARIGQAIVQDGAREKTQIIPGDWITDVYEHGDPDAWERGDFVGYFPGLQLHYRSQWYVLHQEQPLLFGLGVNGQHLFIDKSRQIVIAKASSQAAALDTDRIALTMYAVAALRKYLS